MIRTPLLLALALASCTSGTHSGSTSTPAPTPAAATTPDAGAAGPSERQQVEALLDTPGAIPPAATWKKVGPGALDVLRAMWTDSALPVPRRQRALAAMANVDNPAAADALRKVFADTSVEPSFRAVALEALTLRVRAEALPELRKGINDDSAELREAAARALGLVGGDEAKSILEARLDQEVSPHVRDVLEQTLTRMQP